MQQISERERERREQQRCQSLADQRQAPSWRLLSRDDLGTKGIKYSKAHLRRLILANKFPRPVRLGGNRNAWVESEIDQWISDRIAERDAECVAA